MKYLGFNIKKYRAISDSLYVDIEKKNLIPIIGINECGKTTILNAIFAFDSINDGWNEGKHIESTENLYSTKNPLSLVEARIEITSEELIDSIKEVEKDEEIQKEDKRGVRTLKSKIKKFSESLIIERNLTNKKYSILNKDFEKYKEVSSYIAKDVISKLPYILYFDDFTESVDDKIEIKKSESGTMSTWLEIMERLFKKTDASYSVFDLLEMTELRREGILSDVSDHLNKTLAKEWSRFSLESKTTLKVDIDYDGASEEKYLLIRIKEEIGKGNKKKERFFGIRNRSKGFFWFFNFVMKLEFNPKVRSVKDKDTVYLLDEPGSYLHANAQNKLCEKIALLSKENKVIYCTHSHYLLNPNHIPISSVQVVQKNKKGSISIVPVPCFSGKIKERRGAFQPLLDALEIKPLIFDYNIDNAVLVEGIFDYYLFNLFQSYLLGKEKYKFLPAVNAEAILYNISFMIFSGVNYIAIWDNDAEGRKKKKKAEKYFGKNESKRFILLPSKGLKRKYLPQNLILRKDMNLIKKRLDLPNNTKFEKVIAGLFFSEDRNKIVKKISKETKNNVRYVLSEIELILSHE